MLEQAKIDEKHILYNFIIVNFMKQPLLYEIVQFNLKVIFAGLFSMAVHIF